MMLKLFRRCQAIFPGLFGYLAFWIRYHWPENIFLQNGWWDLVTLKDTGKHLNESISGQHANKQNFHFKNPRICWDKQNETKQRCRKKTLSMLTSNEKIKTIRLCLQFIPLDKKSPSFRRRTPFLNAFSWMNGFLFRFKFHWSVFLRVQLTITQHWLR